MCACARAWVCVGVCVELLNRSKTSSVASFSAFWFQQGAHGHLDGMGHRRPIQVAVQTYLQLLNRDGMWQTQEPPCRFSTRTTSEFELSIWTDEGDFSFIFLHSWRNLRLRWTSCPLQFSAYIVGFFVASIGFILFFRVATQEFSFHSAPNPPVRCSWSVCARQMHSTSKFDKTSLSKRFTHVGATRCREPLGEYLSR